MSKHILFMTISIFVLSSLTLWAQFQDPRHTGITTVSAAQEAKDDTWVTLSGTILRQLGEERYLFQDATGTMVVEIDHEDWGNVTADPETILRISGEIDRDWLTTEIEVEWITTKNASRQKLNGFQGKQSGAIKPSDEARFSGRNLSQFQLH